jgi:hypothetical protein
MIKLKDLLKELESKDNYYISNNIMEPRLAVRKYFNANKDSLEVLMDQDRWNEVYQIIFKEFPQFEQHILSTAINSEALDVGWLTKQVPVSAKLSLDSNSEVGEIQTTVSAWVAKNKNKLIKLADDDEYTKFYQAARDQFPGVQDDKLLFALKVAVVEHDIHYDVLTDGVIKLKDLVKEMAASDLRQVEKYADKELDPVDVDFAKHFFDQVNNPRNGKDISSAELIGFFKRLSKNKKKFLEFIKKYQEFVVKDDKTDINIPFVSQVNKVLAKTIMRKHSFSTTNPVFSVNESAHEEALSYTEEQALELAHKNWSKFTGKVCNSGFCDIYASKLSKLLPGSKQWDTEEQGPSGTLGHVWVEFKGKFYDAETPDGVTDWKDLPWMKEFYKAKKQYPKDIKQL